MEDKISHAFASKLGRDDAAKCAKFSKTSKKYLRQEMQVGQKFSVAIHILLSAEFFKEEKNTSEFLAGTIGTNPVIVRQITLLLKNAGLLKTTPGAGGISLLKSPENITLLDVFNAVNGKEKLFKIHENSPKACPLGGRIEALLSGHFLGAQEAMLGELKAVSLRDLLDELDSV